MAKPSQSGGKIRTLRAKRIDELMAREQGPSMDGLERDAWLNRCREYCRAIKYLGEPLVWDERPMRSGTLQAKSVLLDSDHVAIPHLTFQGEYQQATFGSVFRCKVMHSDAGRTLKVFMLEVYPNHKLSHREPGLEIFGPHVHLGDERVGTAIAKPSRCSIDANALKRWIRRFQRHSRILDDNEARIIPPFEDSLF